MNILSFGAGVQSVTLALMCLNNDYKKPDHIIFSDTGWENESTYQYFFKFKKKFENIIPFYTVNNGNIYKESMDKNANFVSMPLFSYNEKGKKCILRRQCTMQYKIRPINKKIRELCGLKRYQHGVEPVNLWICLTIDEASRMKPNRVKWMINTYPLIDINMSRNDCKEYLKKHKQPIPSKSACVCCPYRSDSYFAHLRESKSKEWYDLLKFEKNLNQLSVSKKAPVFIHSSMKPLKDAIFKDKGEGFINECDGYCGI